MTFSLQDKGEPFRPQRASPPPPVTGQTKQEVVEFADVEIRSKVHQVRMKYKIRSCCNAKVTKNCIIAMFEHA